MPFAFWLFVSGDQSDVDAKCDDIGDLTGATSNKWKEDEYFVSKMIKSLPSFEKLIATGEISCEMILKLFTDHFDFHRMSCEYFMKNIQCLNLFDHEETLSILSNHCKKLMQQNKDIGQRNKVIESHAIALGKAKRISPKFTMARALQPTYASSRDYNHGNTTGRVTCHVGGGSSFVFGNDTQMQWDQWVVHIADNNRLTQGINEFCITLESSCKMGQTVSSYGIGITSHNYNTYFMPFFHPYVSGQSIHKNTDVCMYNGTDGKIYMTGGYDNTFECTDTGKWGLGDTIRVVVDCEKWHVIFFKNGDLACQKVLKIEPAAYYPILQGYRKIVRLNV